MADIALITGITGQDGSYLAEFLLEKGYEVHGLIRRHSTQNTERIDHIIDSPYNGTKFFLHYADMTDSSGLIRLVSEIKPTEVYNLAKYRSIRLKQQAYQRSSCLRRSDSTEAHADIIRHPHQSSSEVYRRRLLRVRRHPSIPRVRMVQPSFIHTGSQSITESHTRCLPATVYSSIMSLPDAVRIS